MIYGLRGSGFMVDAIRETESPISDSTTPHRLLRHREREEVSGRGKIDVR
jgi:hypothetical protein